MKLEKKDRVYIFFIVLLSILLIGVFLLALSGYFFRDNVPVDTYFEVGGSTVLHLRGNKSSVMAYSFDGSYLSGQNIFHNFTIKNDGQQSLFVRAKLTIFSGNNNDPKLNLIVSELWTQAEDGYYYFDGEIKEAVSIGLASGVSIAKDSEMSSSSNYIIVISVEGLSTTFDRIQVWGY